MEEEINQNKSKDAYMVERDLGYTYVDPKRKRPDEENTQF